MIDGIAERTPSRTPPLPGSTSKPGEANRAGNTFFLIRGYAAWWAGLAVGKILLPMTVIPQIDE